MLISPILMLSAVTLTKEEIAPFSESHPFTTRAFH